MSVYLITGGAHGIGADVAMRLHSTGHSILFADIERVCLPGVRSVICDLSDEAQIASLMCGVEAVEGRLDGLFCQSASQDEDAHVTTALLFKAAAPLLRAGEGVAVAVGGRQVPAITRALSRRLGPSITMNWLTAPHEHEGAAATARVTARAADLLVASA
jgi:NAD(P)-dependent dehydrogenase (short-subunit alcohol dehydrogenase family)